MSSYASRVERLQSLPVPEYNLSENQLQRLIRREITVDEYWGTVVDSVDKRNGLGKYKGHAEGPVGRSKEFINPRPNLFRRLGGLLIDGYNPYRNFPE